MIKLTKGVTQLLIINIILFMITYICYHLNIHIIDKLILYPFNSDNFHFYQIITYMFIHSNISHIFFNMIALIIFGPYVEKTFGYNKFIINYLLIGIISGICHIIFINGSIIGASGAIWGIMMIYALIKPNEIIYLFFLIPLKIKWIIGSFLLIEIISLFKIDDISHIAHVSGALIGILIYSIHKYKISLN